MGVSDVFNDGFEENAEEGKKVGDFVGVVEGGFEVEAVGVVDTSIVGVSDGGTVSWESSIF